jgi:glycosyltransferase involved in cell wall biosynthesis|tara:strand:- start:1310 stop:2608 length:1299 start_codon:yes stop_codon:yes gene_type:complete
MEKSTFFISAPFDTYSGYGARSRDVIKSIVKSDKYDVKLLPQRWGNTPHGFINDHEEEWGFLVKHIYDQPQLNQKPDIWLQVTVPSEFNPVGKYNIGMTAGMETTIVHHGWVEGMNRMDINFVSSEHSKQTFLNSIYTKNNEQNQPVGEIKIQKPIEVLFEGANLDVYKPVKSNFDLPQMKESFAYLFVGHWMQGNLGEDRKNVGLLVKAFFELFKNKQNAPALILKTAVTGASYMGRDQIIDKINQIKATMGDQRLPNVYLLHGEFSDVEMNEIYNHPKVKAMVSLTKGEGFGRPLLEFSLTKKPIIATNWSGHIDFLNSEFTSLINGELKNVDDSAVVKDMILKESQWFTPNSGEIGHYLKDMFKNYKKYAELGKRQAHFSKTNFSWEKMDEKLNKYLEENIPEFPKQVKLQLPKLKKIELPKKKVAVAK